MIIILENAINYNTLEEAKEMIRKGKELTDKTGVKTLSKFQCYNKDNLLQVDDLKVREYCKERMFNKEDAKELFEHGKAINQIVFFTPMYDCITELEEIGVEYYKIRFFDRKNFKILDKVALTNKPIFYSTDNTYILYMPKLIHLWCSPKYPSSIEDYANMNLYSFKGVSDHTSTLTLLTQNRELEYWERHVCLDRNKDTCLEKEWVSTFSELEEVLK